MLDVAAVASGLFEACFKQTFESRAFRDQGLEANEIRQWLSLLAGLHDLGKAWPGFQCLDENRSEALQQAGLRWRPSSVRPPHGHVTAAVLADLLNHALNLDQELAYRMAQTLGGHHGTFPLSVEISRAKDILHAWELSTDWSTLRTELLKVVVEVVQVRSAAVQTNSDLDNVMPILIAGFVTVADWIGSDTTYFPHCPECTEPLAYWGLAQKQASRAISALGWSSWRPLKDAKSFGELFRNFQSRARPVQTRLETITSDCLPRLVIVEVPTGEGKTETALLMQDRWCSALQQRGAYIALPTMATSNQMFARVRDFLLDRYRNTRTNLHLLHSHALLHEEYQELRTSDIGRDEPSLFGSIVADEWFMKSKRGLLAPFAVGTVDQALLSVLQTRHGYLRLFGLGGKTIIFDEVHAYDTYMLTLFERLMAWLARTDTTVVILSATLPAERRRALIRAFSGKEPEVLASYPCLTWVTSEGETCSETVEVRAQAPITIEWQKNDLEKLVKELQCLISDGGRVAWICNTVDQAQRVYCSLKSCLSTGEVNLQLFHARFPYGERERREEEVLRTFGKARKGPARSVLVATQVIEQSLDLDFDYMLTDLAPVDLLLQRAGRLHRHDRERPFQFSDRRLVILQPEGHEEGLPNLGNSVYDEYVLLRSWAALKDCHRIRVPEDIAPLVELVYGDTAVEEGEGLQSKFLAAKEKHSERVREMRARALQMALCHPDPEDRDGGDVLEKWSRELEDEDDPDISESLRAMTRLSPPSVNVVCLHAIGGQHFIDKEGLQPVDLQTALRLPRDRSTIEALLRVSVSLSYRGCTRDFHDGMVPDGWRKNPLLRHHRAVSLTDDEFAAGIKQIRLDPELGIVLTRNQERGRNDGSILQSDI